MSQTKQKVMIVDDEVEIRQIVKTFLERSDYEILEVPDGAALKAALNGPQPEAVLLDMKLPDAEGLELLPQLKKKWPETEVIVVTGYGSTDLAVEATKQGAYHFLNKPFDLNALQLQVERAIEHKQITEANSSLRRAIATMPGSPIFQSPPMKEVLRTIERVATSDVSVLLTGESGTGKEVIADLIHSMSPRAKGPNIKINCAALPRELIESELFGSTKGAYTGAQADREGLFRQAEGGTLLLDELSEMPVDTQSKLLRVLQEKEVRPVGGRVSYKADCRIIASTNRKVEDAIREGKLREDLYYRISAISVHLPPLRERREDILPLANAFLKRFATQAGRIIAGTQLFEQIAGDRVAARTGRQRAAQQPSREPRRRLVRHEGRSFSTLSSPCHMRRSTSREVRKAVRPAGVTVYRRRAIPSRAGVPATSFQRRSPFVSRRSSDV